MGQFYVDDLRTLSICQELAKKSPFVNRRPVNNSPKTQIRNLGRTQTLCIRHHAIETEGHPRLLGGQTRHCRVCHCQACSQRANPCMPYRTIAHRLGANVLTAQHGTCTQRDGKLDPQHGVWIGCYGDDDVNA